MNNKIVPLRFGDFNDQRNNIFNIVVLFYDLMNCEKKYLYNSNNFNIYI